MLFTIFNPAFFPILSDNDEGTYLFREIFNQPKYMIPYFLLKPLSDVLQMTNPSLLQGFLAMIDNEIVEQILCINRCDVSRVFLGIL